MSRETWRLLKSTKKFYVNSFRWTINLTIISCSITCFLSWSIYYCTFSQSNNEYYASNGITSPISLVAMDAPNSTSVPLLTDDDA